MFGPTVPAPDANLSQATTDADVGTNPARAPYLAVMASHPGILAAMDYANLAQIYRDAIWASVDDYAADTPTVVANPADIPGGANYDPTNASFPPFQFIDNQQSSYQAEVDLTQQEAADSFGAKVAHALHHEQANTFPWSILKYSNEELKYLFDPFQLFREYALTSWFPAGPTVFATHASNTIDHCPNDTYSIAAPIVAGEPTALSAVAALADELAKVRHWSTSYSDALWSIRVHDLFTYGIEVVQGPPFVPGTLISRSGCHSCAYLTAALCRSVNIPCIQDYGYIELGHSITHWPTIDKTVYHSDDVYRWEDGEHKVLVQLASYSDFVAQVEPLGRTVAGSHAAAELRARNLQNGISGAAMYYINEYSGGGWDALRGFVIDWWLDLPAEQNVLDAIKARLDAFVGFTVPDVMPGKTQKTGYLVVDVVDQGLPNVVSGDATFGNDRTIVGDFEATLPEGNYTIAWGDIYVGSDPSPPTENFTIVAGQTTTMGPPTYVPE